MAPLTKNPNADLATILAAANKKYGPGTIHKASESVPVNRLPFVEPWLNYASEGGTGFGRFMALYGQENSGKTRIALELIAQAQQLPKSAEDRLIPRIVHHFTQSDNQSLSAIYRARHMVMADRLSNELNWIKKEFPNGADAIFYNVEMQFDPLWAQSMGVDLSRLEIVELTTIEEIVEIMQETYQHVPLHVVDSTSNASSYLSQKQPVGKSLMGTDARQWKYCLRDSIPKFDPNRNIGILIHQVATNPNTGATIPQSTKYMKHVSRLSINFMRGLDLYHRRESNGQIVDPVLYELKPTGADEDSMAGRAEPDGRQVFAKVEKSTIGRPNRWAGLQWNHRRSEFTSHHDIATAGLYFGYIVKSGTWYSVAGESDNLGQGLKKVYARLQEDPELSDRITARLLDYTGEN